jgi:hypothetical protein
MSPGAQTPSGDGWEDFRDEPDPDFDAPPDQIHRSSSDFELLDDDEFTHVEKMRAIGILLFHLNPYIDNGKFVESVCLDVDDDEDQRIRIFSGTPVEELYDRLTKYNPEQIEDTAIQPMSAEQTIYEQDHHRVAISGIMSPQEEDENDKRYCTIDTDDYAHDRSTTNASRMFREFLERNNIDITRIADVTTHPEDVDLPQLQERFLNFAENDERVGDVIAHRMTIIRSLNDTAFSRIIRNRLAKNIVIPTLKGSVDMDVLDECIQFLRSCDEEFMTQALQALIYNSSRKTLARCFAFIQSMTNEYGHLLRRGDLDRIHAILISVDPSEADAIPND